MIYFPAMRRILILIILAFIFPTGAVKSVVRVPEKTEYATPQDIEDVISQFSSTKIAAVLAEQRPKPITVSKEQRAAVIRGFPKAWVEQEVQDPAIASNLDSLLSPLFSFYRKHYALFIIRSRTPAVLIDSDSVLIYTTGFLAIAKSDDEVLGVSAHEAAHAFFAQDTAQSKEQYAELLRTGKDQTAEARNCVQKLAKIELACDAIATQALQSMRYNTFAWLNTIDLIQEKFPEATSQPSELPVDFHPSQVIRKTVVQRLSGPEQVALEPRAAKALKTIQTLVAISEGTKVSSLLQ